MPRAFRVVDVFGAAPHAGNPVAVVLDGHGLDDELLQAFASWTNLAETTFVLEPSDAAADYRARIFTPTRELPFAGHPTLGTCHAWLEAGGVPRTPGVIIQQCSAGLIRVRDVAEGLAFAAPPLLRSGPVEEQLVGRLAEMLGVDRVAVRDSQWVDNGPGWVAVLLDSAAAVLALRPGLVELDVGVVGPYPPGAECAFEVRAFSPNDGAAREDPVTGSLNASLAGWLIASGRAQTPYVVSQGGALGRRGRVHVLSDREGAIWVAGSTRTEIAGEVML